MRCIFFVFLLLLEAAALELQTRDAPGGQNEFADISAKQYQKAYDDARKAYRQKITQNFELAEMTDTNRWVSYIDDFTTKSVVDFKNRFIKIQVYATNMQEARQKIAKRFNELAKASIADAFREDFVEQEVARQLNLQSEVDASKPVIGDIYREKNLSEARDRIQTAPIKRKVYQNNNIYSIQIPMPKEAMFIKAKTYSKSVRKYAGNNGLPKELIYAVIDTESSFNPVARSRIPAFGLMQIVPQTAGLDSYRYLYGKKRILSAQYLYNESRNIKIGGAYLYLLFYRYFKDVKEPLNRLYCTIAAYNAGAGNVAKTLAGELSLKKAVAGANRMEPAQLFDFLMANLPFAETKNYLQEVTEKMFAYRSWLQKPEDDKGKK
ncbi:MAG: transglycosylase SLT domain-containing protein [Campylobacterota bacterium]